MRKEIDPLQKLIKLLNEWQLNANEAYQDGDEQEAEMWITKIEEVGRTVFTCPSCFGVGGDCDADDYGATIGIPCNKCGTLGYILPKYDNENPHSNL